MWEMVGSLVPGPLPTLSSQIDIPLSTHHCTGEWKFVLWRNYQRFVLLDVDDDTLVNLEILAFFQHYLDCRCQLFPFLKQYRLIKLVDFHQIERQAFQYLLSLRFLSRFLSFSTPPSAKISPPLLWCLIP